MTPRNGALITLDGVGKTFYTDEVETHALSDIRLEIKAGEYVAIAGDSFGLREIDAAGHFGITGFTFEWNLSAQR